MKFGKQLTHYAIPEWAQHYMSYSELKKMLPDSYSQLSAAESNIEGARLSEGDQQRMNLFEAAAKREVQKVNTFFVAECNRLDERMQLIEASIKENFPSEWNKKMAPASNRKRNRGSESSSKTSQLKHETASLVIGDSRTSTQYYSIYTPPKLDIEINKFDIENGSGSGIRDALITEQPAPKAPACSTKEDDRVERMLKQRIERVLCSMYASAEMLEQFASLNYMGFYKIYKKRDKTSGTNNLVEDILHVREQPFKKVDRLRAIQRKLNRLFRVVTEDATSDHFKIQQEMLRVFSKDPPGQVLLFFFLGACMVLLMDIVIMCFLEPSNPNYRLEELLANIPMFRLSFNIILLFWAVGAAMKLMEHYRVNYRFMLDIDPKCQVSHQLFFLVAAIQTSLWIITFGCYLADLKFGAFGKHELHFLYPIGLMVSQTAIIFLPSDTFRRKYRLEFLTCIGMCCYAMFWPGMTITFVQNIAGDVLTSMAKPLADVEYSVCYYSTGLYHRFPVTCSSVDYWLRPVIVATPYYIRLMQSISRYIEADAPTRKAAHAANAGKYCAGILVVICTSVPWQNYGCSIYVSRFIWVFAYIFATIYMFFWDIYMDWGLAAHPDTYIREQRMYPAWMYYTISLFNLVGRLSWAMNLMPLEILDNHRLNSELTTLWVSAMEIGRRALWALLRLENEHLTNSSRYRAMLWVPPLCGADTVPDLDLAAVSVAKKTF